MHISSLTIAGAGSTVISGNISDYASEAGFSGLLSGVAAGAPNVAGSLTMNGSGTLTLSGSNSYTGTTTVNAGLLQISGSAALPPASSLTVAGGTLDLGRYSFTQLTAAAFQGGILQNGAIDVSAGYSATAGTVSANLGGSGGLDMAGPGNLTLSGSNSYTGRTRVNSGSLTATAPAALPGFGATPRTLVVGSGTLVLEAGGNGWAGSEIDNLLAANGNNFLPGASLAIDTTGGSARQSPATSAAT